MTFAFLSSRYVKKKSEVVLSSFAMRCRFNLWQIKLSALKAEMIIPYIYIYIYIGDNISAVDADNFICCRPKRRRFCHFYLMNARAIEMGTG